VSDSRELSREELLAALAERDAVIAALLAEIEQLNRPPGVVVSSASCRDRNPTRGGAARPRWFPTDKMASPGTRRHNC
jgi:transposase